MGGKNTKGAKDDPAEHDAGDQEAKVPKNCPGKVDIKSFLDVRLDKDSGTPVKVPRLLPLYTSPTIAETDLLTDGAWRLSGFPGGKVKIKVIEGAGLMPVDVDFKKLKETAAKDAAKNSGAGGMVIKSMIGMPVSEAEKRQAGKAAGKAVFGTLMGAKANSADPFIRIRPGGSREAGKTPVREKTMDPIWNYTKRFTVGPAESEIVLVVEDQKTCNMKFKFLKFLCASKKKRSKKNKPMGEARLNLADFTGEGKDGEVWLPVEPTDKVPAAQGKIKVKVNFKPKLTPFQPRCHPYIHLTEPVRHARVRLVDKTVGMVNWDAVYALREPGNLSAHLKGFKGFLNSHGGKKQKPFRQDGFLPLYVPEGQSPFPHRYELNVSKWPPTGNNVLDFIGRSLFYVYADDQETEDWRKGEYTAHQQAQGLDTEDNPATHISGEWPGWEMPDRIRVSSFLMDDYPIRDIGPPEPVHAGFDFLHDFFHFW